MRLAALVCGALLVFACTKPPPASPPTNLPFKLECRNETAVLVYLLDPKSQIATLANVDGQPKGTWSATDFQYDMHFPANGRMVENQARVNRYDGEMEREFGKPPFLTGEIFPKKGNTFQIWQCKRSEAKPAL